MSEQAFSSVPEFALATSLSQRGVWRLLERGALPSLRVGRRRLIPLKAGLAAIERLGGTAPSGKADD